jgi:ABC-type bacteriocin/lantibiotic exporter with double-glycine peptidase domain
MIELNLVAHALRRAALKLDEDHLVVVPDLRQIDDYDCGVSSAQAILAYYGFDFRENQLLDFLDVSKENGTTVESLLRLYKKVGLQVVARNGLTIDNLKVCIDKGYPVQLLVQAWAEDPLTVDWTKEENGHYVVAVGYTGDTIVFEDPSTFGRAILTREALMERWHCRDDEGDFVQFGIAVIGVPQYYPEHLHVML